MKYLISIIVGLITFFCLSSSVAEYKLVHYGEEMEALNYVYILILTLVIVRFIFNLISSGSLTDAINKSQSKKTCPSCKKRVHIEASKCSYCSSELA